MCDSQLTVSCSCVFDDTFNDKDTTGNCQGHVPSYQMLRLHSGYGDIQACKSKAMYPVSKDISLLAAFCAQPGSDAGGSEEASLGNLKGRT